jgi:cytochrome c biogenesis protein CcmG/thiol:disulfide interchange protein DsbE
MEPQAPKPLEGWRAAALIAVAAGLVYFTTHQPASQQKLGALAPALALKDIAGKDVSLADYKGKVVLLNFWATWCEPCQEEIPDLKSLQKKYEAKGFSVIGVSMDSLGGSVVSSFVQKNAMTYPIWIAGGDSPAGYDVPGLPTSFLVDRKGRLVTSYLGPRTAGEFSRDIESVLGD